MIDQHVKNLIENYHIHGAVESKIVSLPPDVDAKAAASAYLDCLKAVYPGSEVVVNVVYFPVMIPVVSPAAVNPADLEKHAKAWSITYK